jgi:hypothetical protein
MAERFRCWECGKSFPLRVVRRRDVQTGSGSISGRDGRGGWITGSSSSWTSVDMCPPCARWSDREADIELAGCLWVGIAVVLFVILISASVLLFVSYWPYL